MVVFGFKINLNLSDQFFGLILVLVLYSCCCICDLDKEIAYKIQQPLVESEQGKKAEQDQEFIQRVLDQGSLLSLRLQKQAKSPLPIWVMYSFILSTAPKLVWILTKLFGSF